MKKLISILILLTVISIQGYSQKITIQGAGDAQIRFPDPPFVIDTAILRVQYLQTLVTDTINQSSIDEFTLLLQIGKNYSKYSDYHKIVEDSLMIELRKQGDDPLTIVNKQLSLGNKKTTEVLLKNYPKGRITTTNSMIGTSYMYDEPIPVINWEMENGESVICEYTCKKASATLFGRKYTAWYTSEIPINNGPWKFSGLPGLILKVEDERNQLSFECIAIEKPQKVDEITLANRNYIKTDKKDFLSSYQDYKENPGAILEASGRIEMELPASTYRKRLYNPIELSE